MSTRKYTFRSVTYQRGNRLWPLQKVCSSEVSLHERTADWHYICTCIRCCPERKQVYVHLLIRIYPGNVGINCKQRLRNATTPWSYLALPAFYVSTLQRLCSRKCTARCHEHNEQRKWYFQKSHADANLAMGWSRSTAALFICSPGSVTPVDSILTAATDPVY